MHKAANGYTWPPLWQQGDNLIFHWWSTIVNRQLLQLRPLKIETKIKVSFPFTPKVGFGHWRVPLRLCRPLDTLINNDSGTKAYLVWKSSQKIRLCALRNKPSRTKTWIALKGVGYRLHTLAWLLSYTFFQQHTNIINYIVVELFMRPLLCFRYLEK
jgi:hypothetical protein